MVDHLIGQADVTDRAVSRDELFAEDDLPESYADKPAAKGKAKKAPAKKAAKAKAADEVAE